MLNVDAIDCKSGTKMGVYRVNECLGELRVRVEHFSLGLLNMHMVLQWLFVDQNRVCMVLVSPFTWFGI